SLWNESVGRVSTSRHGARRNTKDIIRISKTRRTIMVTRQSGHWSDGLAGVSPRNFRYRAIRLQPVEPVAGDSRLYGVTGIHIDNVHWRTGNLFREPAMPRGFFNLSFAFNCPRQSHARKYRVVPYDSRRPPGNGLGQNRVGALLGLGFQRDRRAQRRRLVDLLS